MINQVNDNLYESMVEEVIEKIDSVFSTNDTLAQHDIIDIFCNCIAKEIVINMLNDTDFINYAHNKEQLLNLGHGRVF